MKPYYFQHITNFGDELNSWLWERLIPELIDDDDSTLLIGIGTYLTAEWIPQGSRIVVFSSGAGYGPMPHIDDSWSVYCVRGPLTAKALRLDASAAVTDAGALVRRVYKGNNEKQFPVSFIPHHISNKGGIDFWQSICDELDIHYIDPHLPVDTILTAIDQSELLITEALHGAIVADALRVPWTAIQTGDHILEFKWNDWCQSLGLQYNPNKLFESAGVSSKSADDVSSFTSDERDAIKDRIKQLSDPCKAILSDVNTLDERINELERRLERLRTDFSKQTITEDTKGYAEQVVQEAARRRSVIEEKRTDVERWANPEQLEEFWDKRAEIAAGLVEPGAKVLDLGCGGMAVEKSLPAGCTYRPCDVVARDDRTVICDFNKGEMPDKEDATAIVMLGVLEYIYDAKRFVADLRSYNLPIIMSYIPTDSNIYTNRVDHGWVNHMSWRELAMLLANSGFNLVNSIRIDQTQILLHIVPA